MKLVCLRCMTLADPICSCGNAGALVDVDGHLHIYVEQIASVRLANVYYQNGVEIYRELLEPFDTQKYISYKDVATTPLNFQPFTNDKKGTAVPDIYDRRLMAALDRHEHSIAAEGRIGSTKKQPNKHRHD